MHFDHPLSPRAGRVAAGGRANGRPAPRRPSSARAGGLLFHVPSFSVGLILGAVIVLGTAYLPEILGEPRTPATSTAVTAAPAAQRAPELTFEFDTMLRGATAGAPPAPQRRGPAATLPAATTGNTAAAASEGDRPPQPLEPAPSPAVRESVAQAAPASATVRPSGGDYMLQAASFRNRADAERLRAELLLLDLPAATGEVTLGDSTWYRVTVGPFPDPVSTEAAITRLQERNLAAIVVRR